jgi:glyoxylase-like metal-dependent hydrolase (beta-lactamase superfamily II)
LHTKEIGKDLYLIDLQTGGFHNLISSYVIKKAKTTIIESGPTSSVPSLLLGLKELIIQPADVQYIALTHVHLDHGGGAGTLLKHLPNAKVLVHPKGYPHLVDPDRLWLQSKVVLEYVSDIFGKPEAVPKEKLMPISEGAVKICADDELKVIETLGHASHNLSFFETTNRGVFAGDAAGTYFSEFNAVLPTTPPPFYLESALASIDRLIELKPDFLYYSHFGNASNAIQRLKDYKLQIQLWAKIAVEGVKNKQEKKSILADIISQDKNMNKIFDHLKSHPIYSKTVFENSLEGFIKQAEKTAV